MKIPVESHFPMDAVGEIRCTDVVTAEIIKIEHVIKLMTCHSTPLPQVNTQCHNKLAA